MSENTESYRGAALHKCAYKINAQQPWAHHDPNALPFARGKRRGGERTRKEIEMHLLPKVITSTRQPHLSLALGARKCNFHDSQKGRRRAQYLQIG